MVKLQKFDLEEESQGYRHQFADERDGLTFFIRMRTYTKKVLPRAVVFVQEQTYLNVKRLTKNVNDSVDD